MLFIPNSSSLHFFLIKSWNQFINYVLKSRIWTNILERIGFPDDCLALGTSIARLEMFDKTSPAVGMNTLNDSCSIDQVSFA